MWGERRGSKPLLCGGGRRKLVIVCLGLWRVVWGVGYGLGPVCAGGALDAGCSLLAVYGVPWPCEPLASPHPGQGTVPGGLIARLARMAAFRPDFSFSRRWRA